MNQQTTAPSIQGFTVALSAADAIAEAVEVVLSLDAIELAAFAHRLVATNAERAAMLADALTQRSPRLGLAVSYGLAATEGEMYSEGCAL